MGSHIAGLRPEAATWSKSDAYCLLEHDPSSWSKSKDIMCGLTQKKDKECHPTWEGSKGRDFGEGRQTVLRDQNFLQPLHPHMRAPVPQQGERVSQETQ